MRDPPPPATPWATPQTEIDDFLELGLDPSGPPQAAFEDDLGELAGAIKQGFTTILGSEMRARAPRAAAPVEHATAIISRAATAAAVADGKRRVRRAPGALDPMRPPPALREPWSMTKWNATAAPPLTLHVPPVPGATPQPRASFSIHTMRWTAEGKAFAIGAKVIGLDYPMRGVGVVVGMVERTNAYVCVKFKGLSARNVHKERLGPPTTP